MVLKRFAGYFSLTEKVLWTASVLLTVGSFLLLQRTDYIALAASLVGVTSLILCAKGNPIGQILMVAFSILYAVISYGFAYYGEMLTYLGMTAPMAVVALVEWLRHPYRGNRSEVAVRGLRAAEMPLMLLLAAAVTAAFCFLLLRLGTANMFFSTLSVTTSFVAAYLTFKRSPYFALAYAANDVVLIVLWVLASLQDPAYVSVTVCFAVFLVNDLYGFLSWRKMRARQEQNISAGS